MLGTGESFVIVGAQSLGFALTGPRQAGKVISWMGTALYAALAAGAPLGSMIIAA